VPTGKVDLESEEVRARAPGKERIVRVGEKMTREVITISPKEGVMVAKHILDEKRIRHLPVVSDGKLVGIITDRDIRRNLPSPVPGLEIHEMSYLLDKLQVQMVMTREVISVTPQTSIEAAANLLVAHKIGGLPVLDGERLVGIITEIDLLKALLKREQEEGERGTEETGMCWLANAMRRT
jgi:acetoin utilization protein AcuB